MSQEDWLRPEVPTEAAGSAWNGRREANRFELRPLSLGEVLDRTFALYRSHFWLFAGISMIAATVNVIGQGISLIAVHQMAGHLAAARTPTPAASPAAALAGMRGLGAATLGAYSVGLVFVLVSAVTHAATALAMTKVYLQQPTSVGDALGRIGPRWYRWIAMAIWQAFSFAWLPATCGVAGGVLLGFGTRSRSTALAGIGGGVLFLTVFAAMPAGVIFYLRNALAVPAAVTEGLTLRPAMRRSKALAAGSKGRIFVVLLIALCLLEVVGILQTPATMLMLLAPNKEHYLAQAISLLLTFAGHTVVAPVALIGLTLVYFDQRVRKEALDLELLLEGTRTTTVLQPVTREQPEPERYAP